MDVRQYYRKLRDVESGIANDFVLVTSLETSDGGKPGIVSEVSREQAARLIVEARVTLSTAKEQKTYFDRQAADKKAFEKSELARRLQVTIVTGTEDQNHHVTARMADPEAKK